MEGSRGLRARSEARYGPYPKLRPHFRRTSWASFAGDTALRHGQKPFVGAAPTQCKADLPALKGDAR